MNADQHTFGVSSTTDLIVDDGTFDVLNAIYLRKLASVAHVADVTGQDPSSIEKILKDQLSDESVVDLEEAWLLQPPGTAKVLAFYQSRYADLRADGAIVEWYEKFETALNQQFIKAVSDWQTSDGDLRAQEKMAKLVQRMIRNLGQIVDSVPRYALYITRFERAMAKADRGERDFVCKPTVDSMHNIWFEFHEDILAVVGRPRDV